jgi:mRNA interferase RelE/StbE
MASYNILLKPSVERDLRSLPKTVIARVMRQIESLEDEPVPRHSVKLAGAEQLYRIRVGDYRIVYGIDKEMKQVLIHYVRHRREAYR